MMSLVARPAVAFLITAILAGASQSGSVRAQEANPDSAVASSTEVVVEPADRLGGISPLLYGVNHRYGYNGFGMWDAGRQQAYPDFVQQVEDAGLSAVRFPGGTIANLYHWKRAIGPVAERELNVHGGSGEPLTNEFGPDEFGGFIEELVRSSCQVRTFLAGTGSDNRNLPRYERG